MSRFDLKGRRARIGAAAIATAAATLALAAVPAQASPFTTTDVVDLTGRGFSCADGVTYTVISGDAVFVFHVNENNGGGTHYTLTIAPSNVLLASSANGATYHLAGTSSSHGIIGAGGSFNGTDTENLQIVGPGGVVGNAQIMSHITVNANGTATASFQKFSGNCSGL